MLLVVMIVALLAGISYPSIAAGIDSLRIAGAASETAAILNAGLARADRRQQPVEVTILPAEGRIQLLSPDPGFARTLEMPPGVVIEAVLPPLFPSLSNDARQPRRFLLYPDGAPPRIGVVLADSRGSRRTVRIDPISGVPRIERESAPRGEQP